MRRLRLIETIREVLLLSPARAVWKRKAWAAKEVEGTLQRRMSKLPRRAATIW
jgi:hypothetical protein